MKICVAQTKAIPGDIDRNIENHKTIIEMAASRGAEIIVFPELSLTGYEPTLAQNLATNPGDNRFVDFQYLSNSNQITIGVGMPITNATGICISLILFQPGKPRLIYSKKFLHRDEEPFFVSGENFPNLRIKETNIAFAICYEISVREHAESAIDRGAEVYIASVAKSAKGVENACRKLSAIAKENSMPVFMSNCIGKSDDFVSAGRSSIWKPNGTLAGQLDDISEGILIYDTGTRVVDNIIQF